MRQMKNGREGERTGDGEIIGHRDGSNSGQTRHGEAGDNNCPYRAGGHGDELCKWERTGTNRGCPAWLPGNRRGENHHG